MRIERDTDSKEERKLTRSLLEMWKEIRDVRNKQGFNNTTHRLVIKKVSS